ncbi:hypothetical protein HZS_3362 [Henneguya salminicola]|nr:hypothetical protein HZS_3362 [Henneguya salminicola]
MLFLLIGQGKIPFNSLVISLLISTPKKHKINYKITQHRNSNMIRKRDGKIAANRQSQLK